MQLQLESIVLKAKSLPDVSPAVDANFMAEVETLILTAGHDVEMLAEPYSDAMGHAGAVVLHPDGTCEGGHDPRADGGAAGA